MDELHCLRIDHIANELIRSYVRRVELTSHPYSFRELNNINSDIAQLQEEMHDHRLQCPFCRLGGATYVNGEPSASDHKRMNSYVA